MDKSSEFESNELIIEKTKQALLQLANEPADLKRTLKALGYITRVFQSFGIRPVLVGGQAVEVYTFGNHTTKDIDFVLTGSDLAGRIFVALGFEPKSRGHSHWSTYGF